MLKKNAAKTIWYCHPYAGSPSHGMSYRPYYLTQEFNSIGHRAFVIGASFHHLLQQPFVQNKPVAQHIIDDVPCITFKTRQYAGNGVGRLLNMMSYARAFKRYLEDLLALTGRPDVIIVSSAHPFHFPPLQKIARRFHATLIFEVRDLWPLSLQSLLTIPSWHPLILWLARIERLAYQRADKVVSVLSEAFPYMNKRGLSLTRFHVIPNGVNIEKSDQEEPLSLSIQSKLQTLKETEQYLVGYAGAMGKPNALQYLIDAIAILARNKKPIHAVLVGEGALKDALIKQVHELNISHHVTFLPAITKKQVPHFLKQMDALYLGWNDVSIYQYGVSPNKLFDYMMAAKPIVESGGAPSRMIEKVGCGLNCAAASAEAIAACLTTLYLTPKEKQIKMGLLGRDEVKQRYDYKLLAQQYAELFVD